MAHYTWLFRSTSKIEVYGYIYHTFDNGGLIYAVLQKFLARCVIDISLVMGILGDPKNFQSLMIVIPIIQAPATTVSRFVAVSPKIPILSN